MYDCRYWRTFTWCVYVGWWRNEETIRNGWNRKVLYWICIQGQWIWEITWSHHEDKIRDFLLRYVYARKGKKEPDKRMEYEEESALAIIIVVWRKDLQTHKETEA